MVTNFILRFSAANVEEKKKNQLCLPEDRILCVRLYEYMYV